MINKMVKLTTSDGYIIVEPLPERNMSVLVKSNDSQTMIILSVDEWLSLVAEADKYSSLWY
jgi:hypothetical protein